MLLPADSLHNRPQDMDNRASRPLSHTEAMCRPVSSWVGDYQRITAVDCFCPFAFPFPSLDNEIVIARHKDPYGGPRIISVFYSGTPGGLNPYFPGKMQALMGSSQSRFLSTNHTAPVISANLCFQVQRSKAPTNGACLSFITKKYL
jgi:hypothetical protein